MTTRPAPAILVLEDGTTYRGRAYGATGEVYGEAVFSTGMTGYQETLTDPSYCGQIVAMTAPHIGNTGTNDEDMESQKIWVSGFIVRDPARRTSNWRAQRDLEADLRDSGVVSISGIDTRALTRKLRSAGSMRAGIFSGEALLNKHGDNERNLQQLVHAVQQSPQMAGANFVDQVSVKEVQTLEPKGPSKGVVVAVDLGLKNATPRAMAERGLTVKVVPADYTFEQIKALNPDACFFSNGPGDPAAADAQVQLLRQILDAKIPFFGICFGNQLLGRALGFDTYKLTFGHRGINQPVKDLDTGKVEITAQNHGFAVKAPVDGSVVDSPFNNGHYGRVKVSHVGLNDQVVEGLRCLDINAYSVQYHPEAAAGPHDAAYLFDRLLAMITAAKAGTIYTATLSTAKDNA